MQWASRVIAAIAMEVAATATAFCVFNEHLAHPQIASQGS